MLSSVSLRMYCVKTRASARGLSRQARQASLWISVAEKRIRRRCWVFQPSQTHRLRVCVHCWSKGYTGQVSTHPVAASDTLVSGIAAQLHIGHCPQQPAKQGPCLC
ncbi:hypothetical protein ABBQ32_14150 [Trebouxia sp. C0010 RCD-2024]